MLVNWWQQIRHDLKTIISTGWHHSLIPDEYLIAEFFQAQADEIEALEATISEAQGELAEAVESAQEVAAYEPDEDEKVTATVMKKALKAIEKRIKDAKATLKAKANELEHKLLLKRLGGDDIKAESRDLIKQVESRLAALDPKDKSDNKKINALKKDKVALQARIARTDTLLTETGGQLSPEQARALILRKICDIARAELDRYLSAEKRALVHGVENLSDKYAMSNRELESARTETMEALSGFVASLGYLP